MGERWTEETAELVAASILGEQVDSKGHADYLAEEILAALADAGLLVPPGGETQQEWGYRRAPLADWIDRCCTDPQSCHWGRGHTYRRTVHTGPWLPVTEGGTDG